MAYIVTGYTGQPHITSADESSFNRGLIGLGDYLLGNGIEANAIESENGIISIPKMEVSIQGVHCRVEGNERITVPSASQGMYRKDIIAGRYSKTAEGIESFDVMLVQGSAASSVDKAQLPALNQGNISDGATERQTALFVVTSYGSTIQSIARAIPYVPCLADTVQAEKERTFVKFAAKSIANNTNAVLGSFKLKKGKQYLIIIYAEFPKNATGYRSMCLSKYDYSWAQLSNGWTDRLNGSAVNNTVTLRVANLFNPISADADYYVKVWQDSGAAMSVEGGASIIEL